jgi:hypothetical protein
MYEDSYDAGHPGLDPEWDGHFDDGEGEDFPEQREDFGWFGEVGLWD